MIIDFDNFIKNIYPENKIFTKQFNDFFLVWKPSGLASSFGKQKSFLDLLENKEIQDKNFVENQLKNFDKESEYGLLNRLDNATSGFLYFAKNTKAYELFKKLQKENKINKFYYAAVKGDFPYEKYIVDFPIMHKNKSKMIAIQNPKDIKKGRGKQHFVKTEIKKILYDKKNNISWLKVRINKGIRHQIRVHLASINYPILNDKLYSNQKNDYPADSRLHLFSVGFDYSL